jgi:hypothetical protein
MLKALTSFIHAYRRQRGLRWKPRLVALESAFYMAWCNSAKLSRDRWEWLFRSSLWFARRAREQRQREKSRVSARWRKQEMAERAEYERRWA